MKFKTIIASSSLLLVCSLFTVHASGPAQDNDSPCDITEADVLAQTPQNTVSLITAFTPAKALERVDPMYPSQVARAGAEGWVQLSYVIDTDGKVQDPVVEDFGGHRALKRSALNAISKWQFSPAMKDGEAVEQCHQAVQFNFTINGNDGASRGFIKKYRKATARLQSEKYAEAEEIIAALHENKDHNRYENAWLWNADALLARQLGDTSREMNSIRKTLASSESHKRDKKTFNDDYIGFLHSRLFGLQAQAGRFGAALQTAKKIKKLPDGETRLKSLESMLTQIHALVDSDEHVYVKVELEDEGHYFHNLVRNKFAFANIKGQVDSVEVRCEARREKFTVAEGHVWSIPSTWGKCRVMVEGDSDTSFDLVEISKI